MLDEIRSARLLLRCWRPEDAPQLRAAIDVSLPELRAWVPWAMGEPSSLEALTARLTDMRRRFMTGDDWAFAVFDRDETRLLGGAGLHPRGTTDHLEIGYWLRTDETGHGFAVEAAQVLSLAGFAATSVDRLEIHCDAENGRSAAVARRLGFQLTRTFRQDVGTERGEQRDTQVWTLLRSQSPSHESGSARPVCRQD